MAYNPAYTVTIMSVNDSPDRKPILIQAPMPETFMYDASVMYEAPFAQGLTGNDKIDAFARLGSMKLSMHVLTAQLWLGSSDTELGFELEFHAERDPVREVRDPILSLLKLATPGINKLGFLDSPGPHFDMEIVSDLMSYASQEQQIPEGVQGEVSQQQMTDTNRAVVQGSGNTSSSAPNRTPTEYVKSKVKNQISIRMGKFAFFDSVVITNVQKTYESQFDAITGLPFYAKVAVRFKPLFMVTQADLDKIFGVSNTSVGAVAPTQNIGTEEMSKPTTEAAPPEVLQAQGSPASNPSPDGSTRPSASNPWPRPSGSIRGRIDAGGYPKRVE